MRNAFMELAADEVDCVYGGDGPTQGPPNIPPTPPGGNPGGPVGPFPNPNPDFPKPIIVIKIPNN
jgi:hypothetical protein